MRKLVTSGLCMFFCLGLLAGHAQDMDEVLEDFHGAIGTRVWFLDWKDKESDVELGKGPMYYILGDAGYKNLNLALSYGQGKYDDPA